MLLWLNGSKSLQPGAKILWKTFTESCYSSTLMVIVSERNVRQSHRAGNAVSLRLKEVEDRVGRIRGGDKGSNGERVKDRDGWIRGEMYHRKQKRGNLTRHPGIICMDKRKSCWGRTREEAGTDEWELEGATYIRTGEVDGYRDG